MQFDGNLTIAVGLSATSTSWKNTKMLWSDLASKLTTEYKTSETYKEYMRASKDDQNRIKDVGGFVGGLLNGGKRSKSSVLNRSLITLDIDFGHADIWWDFTMLYDCAAVIHGTHKNTEANHRFRLILPLSRPVSPEEYGAVARRIAGNLNINLFDNTTFEPNRLMFWPSTPKDISFYAEQQDGPWLDPDVVLATYDDWQDITQWPSAEAANKHIVDGINKQEDPTTKGGIVGLFCRTYTIESAIEAFLSDVYTEAGDGRYTYCKGSTAGGLVVYEDLFAYSHHGTDPCSGKLCNAFDLVRLHKFGHLDTGTEKSPTEAKSYKQMELFVTKDKPTKRTLAAERFADIKTDFTIESSYGSETSTKETTKGPAEEVTEEEDTTWTENLEVDTKGNYLNSSTNLNIILQNDPNVKGIFKLNVFDNKRYVLKSLPWRKIKEEEPLRDVDYSGLRNYIESVYGIVSVGKIEDALALEIENHSFHPIVNYLKSLKWDGEDRIDSLLIDYFGAPDTQYTRMAMRKMLVGAVARVLVPGVKFDLVLTLVGGQGIYKSTFINKLGKKWFSDTFNTVQGKEAFEQVQGAWIIEIAELSGLKKAEVEVIKQYISKREDQFRPAYGRTIEIYKRQCVFFGTTNNDTFLRDPTGNRRFMPVDVRPDFITKSVKDDLTEEEIDQIWAEAYELYICGETLYLDKETEKLAFKEQCAHSETDDRRGLVEIYLNTLLPEEWYSWDLYTRRDYLNDPLSKKGTIKRDSVCVSELWCECLGKDKAEMSRYNTRDLNDIMKTLPDWHYVNSTKNFTAYGTQKYYAKKID